MRPLDLKALIESSEKVIALTAGDVRVRRVSRTELQSLMPPRPEPYPEWEKAVEVEVKALAKEEQASRRADLLVQRELEWLESLTPAERVTRREETLEGLYRVVARASLEPVLTVDLVKRLGDEAFTLLAGIQDFWKADEKAEKNGDGQVLDAVESAA
jgi:hypothetical protein